MKLALAGALLLVFAVPVVAQDTCVTVEQDKAKAEAVGLAWLGVRDLPFSDDQAVFYSAFGRVFLSPLVDGCVSPDVHPVGVDYVPEAQA